MSDSERTVGRAWMLLCALHPEHFAAELEALVTGLERADADEQDWWRALRDQTGATPAQLAAALLSHSMAEEQTHRQRRQQCEERAGAAEEKRRARLGRRIDFLTTSATVLFMGGVAAFALDAAIGLDSPWVVVGWVLWGAALVAVALASHDHARQKAQKAARRKSS